ncbi:MAG: hypothetical protein HY428_00650, partial [Candidatus Levybacteria bacterium]|nr:hypothetical protein [Candidatus Levybacteria bacterium]
LTIQVTNSSGSVLTGTYAFVFNVSNSSNCSDMASILYTNSTTIDTDTRGIINMYLPNVTLDYDIQYWLCYFRNSTLQDTVKIARVPYVFDAKNISAQGIKNDSNLDLANFNVTASNFIGTLNWSDIANKLLSSVDGIYLYITSGSLTLNETKLNTTIGIYNTSLKNYADANFILNTGDTATGTYDFNGGWQSSGLTISGGDLYAQTIFVYNITSLNVNNLNINGSLIPQAGLDDTFDLGNSSLRWSDLFLSDNAYINGSLATANFSVTSTVLSSLVPFDNTKDIGSATVRWRTIYVDVLDANNISAGAADIGGTTFDTFTLHTNNTGNDTTNITLAFERGLLSPNAAIMWDSVSDRFDLNFPLYIQPNNNLTVDTNTLFVDAVSGRVGIGTTAPTNTLNVVGDLNVSVGNNITFDDGTLFLNSVGNRIGINTTFPNNTLHILGSLNVTGNVSIGGNLTFEQADYAELFESDVDLERGDVVCLDAEKKISKCQKRADNSVVGAVSMNPSIIGRNLGFKQAYAVGLVGVVPVKVKGPVERFDLLTSSSVQGYAETATLRDFGAIIGKSMEPCDSGKKCVVDVLVGLN